MARDFCKLGIKFFNNQEYDKAIESFRKALQLNPGLIHAYNYIGNAFQEKKQFGEAIPYYEKSIEINPADPTAYINMGLAFHNIAQFDKAAECFKKAIHLNPRIEDVYHYLGLTLIVQGKLTEALESYRLLLRINPRSLVAHIKMGSILKQQGRLNESESHYRLALKIQPGNPAASQSLIMTMLYNPRYDAQTIFSEHLKFARLGVEPLTSPVAHANERIPNRRLKIGYVSADFKRNPVSWFIEPVLMCHSSEDFEIFCYANVHEPDEVTSRIQSYSEHWRSIFELSDNEAAELIRKDKIDILIDLSGHAGGNRMFVFARKPAPVQVSWIGYPATTGLSTIDYKIVDSYTDPPGMTERFYTERLIRLPESFICYLPDKDAPEVGALPTVKIGHITFGSFNNFAKVNPEVYTLWGKILHAIPGSHLILKDRSFSDSATCQYVMDMFVKRGIPADRIELLTYLPSMREHLSTYNRVDIGLDTFPYNGTTTTCEAMLMGVPVIVLAGNAHAGRVGVSLLSNVGLAETVATTQDEYVKFAVKLANDTERLKIMRKILRDMMLQSPLLRAEEFTRHLENLYLKIWETQCQNP